MGEGRYWCADCNDWARTRYDRIKDDDTPSWDPIDWLFDEFKEIAQFFKVLMNVFKRRFRRSVATPPVSAYDFTSLINSFTNERARRLCEKSITEYATNVMLSDTLPDDMQKDLRILITLVKEFADKPTLQVITHVQNMPTIGKSNVGKSFIKALREEL